MTFSHWFEQLCAGDLPYLFDLICYWNYHSNLINSLLINQPFVAAITLIRSLYLAHFSSSSILLVRFPVFYMFYSFFYHAPPQRSVLFRVLQPYLVPSSFFRQFHPIFRLISCSFEVPLYFFCYFRPFKYYFLRHSFFQASLPHVPFSLGFSFLFSF